MQRAGQAGLTNLFYGVALNMLLGLHSLCIREGPAIAEPWSAFCPQQTGNGDAVNRRFRSSSFHARKDSTEQADSTRKWLFPEMFLCVRNSSALRFCGITPRTPSATKSYPVYARHSGGLFGAHPEFLESIKKGKNIGTIRPVFGRLA